MNLRRTILIARKSLREMLREPVVLLFSLLLPGFFMLINYVGFGAAPKTATYPIWVIQNSAKASPMVDQLKAAHYADGRPEFAITLTQDRSAAEEVLKNQQAVAILIFNEDASGQVEVTTRGDAVNMAFNKASVQLESILTPLLEAAQGKPQRISFQEHPLSMARPISDFDAYAPGMMVFAILLLIPQTAMLVGRELRRGTLSRLDLTRLRSAELLGGICLAQMAVAAVQVILMFGTALALGFHNRGSLVLALGIGLALAFGSVGMGLVVAGFIRNDTDALNTGSAVSMIQVFLSGAFFAFTTPALFILFGHQIGIFDILPATHAMLALQQVLVGGAELSQVAFRVVATMLLSMVYFGLSVWFFSARRLRMAV